MIECGETILVHCTCTFKCQKPKGHGGPHRNVHVKSSNVVIHGKKVPDQKITVTWHNTKVKS